MNDLPLSSEKKIFDPPLAPYGITRAGDLTELDVIGLPVWFAVRPNSRTLSVSQGKGLTHQQARLSAIMEAIEGAVAQQTRPIISKFGTPAAVKASGASIVPLNEISRCKFASFDERLDRAWVPGVCYRSGQPVFAPYELIGLDMRVDFPWDYSTFNMGSSGIAAGFDFQFAALAAILELVERDAVSFVELFGLNSPAIKPIKWSPGRHQGLDCAVGKIMAANLSARFFLVHNRIGIPVIFSVITRPVLDATGSGVRLSGGYACRFDMGDAALAALLEAVQSRLTNIAGSRDDLDASEYAVSNINLRPEAEDLPLMWDLADGGEDRRDSNSNLNLLLDKLSAIGLDRVYLFDLPGPVPGIHVVRALVPGLKVFAEGSVFSMQISDFGSLGVNLPGS